MYPLRKSFFLFLFIIGAYLPAEATHLVGGELTYECIGTNAYVVRLKLYRDCLNSTVDFESPAEITVWNPNNANIQTIGMQLPNNIVIEEFDPCIVNPPNVCIQAAVYQTVLSVPQNVIGDYIISYQSCCRNGSIGNITNPLGTGNTYWSTIPSELNAVCNSSPSFNFLPPTAVCVFEPLYVDLSASDSDGDSLVYELCTPFDDTNNAPPFLDIAWLGPYNINNQLGGTPALDIDPVTGALTGMPNLLGQYLIGVRVKEYRNGIYLGATFRDFQFNVTDCLPYNGFDLSFDQGVYTACDGDTICPTLNIDLDTSHVEITIYNDGPVDVNPTSFSSDTITVTGLSDATIGASTLVSVCLDLSLPNQFQTSAILYCPDGTSIFLYALNEAFGINLDQTCFTPDAIAPISSGIPPYSGEFSPFSATPFTDFIGCTTNGDWTISINNSLGNTTGTLNSWSLSFMTQNEIASAEWNTNMVIGDPLYPCIADSGNYSVTLTDLQGCSVSESFDVIINPTGDPTWTLPPSPCLFDLPITLSPDSDYTGLWSGTGISDNGDGTASFSPAAAGSYDVSYCVTLAACTTCETFTIDTQDDELSDFSIDAGYCLQDSILPIPSLLSASTSGGTFSSIPAIPMDSLTGELTGIGSVIAGTIIEVIYTSPGTVGCFSSSSQFIEVLALPDATFDPLPSLICSDDFTTIMLNPITTGGSFSGDGVIGSTFDPSSLPAGNITTDISYTLNVAGCENTSTQTINVNTQDVSDFSILNDMICEDDGLFPITILNANSTPDGIWSISGGSINATTGQIDISTLIADVNYTVSYETTGICSSSTSADFTIQSAPEITLISSSNASCNMNNGGSAISISSSSGSYSVSWYDIYNTVVSTTENLSGVAAGSYTAIITDDITMCTESYTVTILDDGTPNISQDIIIDPSCGQANGSISVSASGGQAPMSYSWSHDNSLDSPSASNLISGSYTAYITDANNCIDSVEIIITDTGLPSIDASLALIEDVNCATASDGSISDISVAGGDGSYSYEWTDAAGTSIGNSIDLIGLSLGDYTLTVSDGAGCTDSMTITISDENNAPIVLAADVAAAICGEDVGSLTSVTYSGGADNVLMYWTDITGTIISATSSSEDMFNLSAGDYTVWLSDDAGCEGQMTFTVPSSDALIVSGGIVSDASCGQNDGEISGLTISGGDGSYSYEWSDGVSTIGSSIDITGLPSGAYVLTVSDASGCSEIFSYSINDTNGPSLSGVSISGTSCGDASGTLSGGIISGGSAPYIYEWSDIYGTVIGNAIDISGLLAGSYTLTVTDQNGCETSDTYMISDEPAPTLSLGIITEENCGQSDGSISSVLVTGGTGTMNYEWVEDSAPGTVLSTDADLTAVPAGNYTLTVTDTNYCSESLSFSIADIGYVSLSSATVIDANCGMNDGNISGSIASGGDGTYIYTWSDSSGIPISGAPNSPDYTNISAGTYILTVTDANGCDASETIIVNDIPGVSLGMATLIDANCGYADGSITAVDIIGTGPFTYEWSDASGPFSNDPDILSLEAGSYTLTVSDANGCEATQSYSVSNIGSILDPTFSFYSSTYCISDADPLPDFIAAPGGSFSSAPGLILNASDGAIDISSSLPGDYTVTYSTAPPCPAVSTFDISIIDLESVSFTYGSSTFCSMDIPAVTSASLADAVFFSSDFSVDPLTGAIDLSGLTAPFTGIVFSSTNSDCSDTTEVSISIIEDDDSDFSYASSDFCLLDADPLPNFSPGSTGVFSASAGLIIDSNTGQIDLSSAGTGGTFTITYMSDGSCPTFSEETVTISSFLDASFSIPSNSYCTSDGYSLAPINISTSGGIFSSDNGIDVDPLTGIIALNDVMENTSVNLTYTTPGICGDAYSEQINIAVSPPSDFSIDVNTCTETMHEISALNNVTSAFSDADYIWNFGEANVMSGSAYGPYEISYANAGSYSISLNIDNDGCISDTVFYNTEVSSLSLSSEESASLSMASSIDLGTLITVNSSNNDLLYQWSPSTGLSCIDCPNPIANPTSSTSYQLSISDPLSGCSQSTSITVEVLESEIFIPNAFTPDGDGLNDSFLIYGGAYSDILIRVYNRWGEMMFETRDAGIGWNGVYKENLQNPGVYVYTVNYRSLDQRDNFLSGNITLLR